MSVDVTRLAEGAESRVELWTRLIQQADVRTVAEIGVYRGRFAAALLDACPQIETYYMIDPWRNLADWNKPANTTDERFEAFYREAMERTAAHADRRVVLRGTTTEVIDEIPDGSLDLAYVDGDHTLRGITIDLVRALPKVRDGGWLGGDDFCPSIWQHHEAFEPTLVFPLAVHFAEAVGAPIYALGRRQFLIHRAGEHAFVDLTGRYGGTELGRQLTKTPQRRGLVDRLRRW
jgi:hypothetical protein